MLLFLQQALLFHPSTLLWFFLTWFLDHACGHVEKSGYRQKRSRHRLRPQRSPCLTASSSQRPSPSSGSTELVFTSWYFSLCIPGRPQLACSFFFSFFLFFFFLTSSRAEIGGLSWLTGAPSISPNTERLLAAIELSVKDRLLAESTLVQSLFWSQVHTSLGQCHPFLGTVKAFDQSDPAWSPLTSETR